MDGWRGRIAGLAIVAILAAGSAAAIASDEFGRRGSLEWALVVRDAGGEIRLRVTVRDGRFTLRYRNSVYGSPAEEHFTITGDGRIALVGLGADEAAVLDEYYQVADRPRPAPVGATTRWLADPAAPLSVDELSLAVTEHGRRTLVVDRHPPIALWPLVDAAAPSVTIAAEKPMEGQ